MVPDLNPCPCCGGQAIYKQVNLYMDTGWRVQCIKCKLKTMFELIDHPNFPANGLDESTRYTEEQAKQRVADVWNRRVGE